MYGNLTGQGISQKTIIMERIERNIMSKNLKKFFAMTLAVIMVLAMLPTGVFAADAD